MSNKTDSCLKKLDELPTRFTAAELCAVADVSTALVNGILSKEVAKGTLKKKKNGRGFEYTKVGDFKASPERSACSIPVNERFKFIQDFTEMVGTGAIPSLLLTGQAGVGKTHSVLEALTGLCMVEGEDFRVIKGHSSALGLYKALHDNQEGLTIFDDCDSCWKDPIALNILKAALDSYSKRCITWNSLAAERSGLPETFEFKGQIIFISNMDARKMDPAVVSRTVTCNLTMTNDEIIDRMEGIASDIEQQTSMSAKEEVIGFLRENQSKFTGLSLRTFIQACRFRHSSENWQNMVLWTLAEG